MRHIPVLKDRVVEYLVVKPGGKYIDATVGFGGHAKAILEKDPTAKVLGIDADAQILEMARRELENFGERVILQLGNYQEIVSFALEAGFDSCEGVLADLGLNSFHLSDPSRGFSFRLNSPLDMRFNRQETSLTAEDIVNQLRERELEKIFREFGEERSARRLSAAVVNAREKKRIESTRELVEILARHIPARRRVDVLSRVFQALRIAVNNELDGLQVFLKEAIKVLGPGGRIAVISYHSLEDRIVKNFLRSDPNIRVITKKVLRPDTEEITQNRRSRSAKMRVGEWIIDNKKTKIKIK